MTQAPPIIDLAPNPAHSAAPFHDPWRRAKSRAFDLPTNSTARRLITFPLWGQIVSAYANANLSLYSAQRCNAACPFCVEELRPASRGIDTINNRGATGPRTPGTGAMLLPGTPGKSMPQRLPTIQNPPPTSLLRKPLEPDDEIYFTNLAKTLTALRLLSPTLSITGGEPSKDPRLPRLLQTIAACPAPRKTLTTNGSGLLDLRNGQPLIDHITAARLDHLNISIALPDEKANAQLMRLPHGLTPAQLRHVVTRAAAAGTRVRLSCVLLQSGVHSLPGILAYLDFARDLGIDNVIFRQLMKSDPATHAPNAIVQFSDRERIPLEPLLDQISADPRFTFIRQIMGYYYYVEVWQYHKMDVVFEEADLAHLEAVKRREPHIIHELIFHPNAQLASTWQPWDGLLGPSTP